MSRVSIESAPTAGRRLWLAGAMALVPPLAYLIGGWQSSGIGRPFMFAGLFAPDASHTAIGLALLAIGKVLCPLVAIAVGGRLLWAEGANRSAVLLLASALVLLALNLATRQPYAHLLP